MNMIMSLNQDTFNFNFNFFFSMLESGKATH